MKKNMTILALAVIAAKATTMATMNAKECKRLHEVAEYQDTLLHVQDSLARDIFERNDLYDEDGGDEMALFLDYSEIINNE